MKDAGDRQGGDGASVRVAHVSDVHVYCPDARWAAGDYLNKRLVGTVNLKAFKRGRAFAETENVLTALHADFQERDPDLVVFSGDATAFGFEEEFARAAELLGVHQRPGFAVPGNHDYYTPKGAASGLFEKYFGSWLQGERIGDETYPFCRNIGPACFLGVNSCTGNRWFWDAAGTVGDDQRQRLSNMLNTQPAAQARTKISGIRNLARASGCDSFDSHLDNEYTPIILVTHYPMARANGEPESAHHGLRDLAETMHVVRGSNVSLWLHGHRHDPYHLPATEVRPCPSICAGSTTHSHYWSYGEYVISKRGLAAKRRVYDPAARGFQVVEEFAIDFPTPARSASDGLGCT